MINQRLYWWLEANNLNITQAGFRNGYRTEDELFRLVQGIIDGFHDKKHRTAVFVDLQQAYNRVWRKGLLLKMQSIGIHGKMHSWIKKTSSVIVIKKVNDATSSKRF